jgi:hypothetical protein
MIKSALLAATLALGAGAAQAASVFATQIDAGRTGVAGIGWDAETQVFNTNRDDAGNALGAPDQVGNTEGGFFSMGNGQAVVLGFGTAFGTTANIFEVTFSCNGPQTSGGFCNFSESVDVYAFNGPYTPFDGTFGLGDLTALGFTFQASVPNGTANTAGGASVSIGGPFTYLALVDTSAAIGDGFDIDAVSVSAVPLPASALLLIAGLGGLGALRRFKRA